MMNVKMQTSLLALAAWALFLAAPARAQYNYNYALQLDGDGDFVAADAPYPTGMEMTIEGWIKTSVGTGQQTIVSRYRHYSGSNLDDAFHLELLNGVLLFQVNPGNSYHVLSGRSFIADGRWHHVMASYKGDGTGMHLAVDGVWENQRSLSGALNDPLQTTLLIGSTYHGALHGGQTFARFFNGQIDELRIWDRFVTDIFKDGIVTPDPFAPPQSPTPEFLFLQTTRIPVRDRSGYYPLKMGWRFNRTPDSGYHAQFFGNAAEVPVTDLPLNLNNHVVLDGAEEYLTAAVTPPLGPGQVTVEARVRSLAHGGGLGLQSIVSKYRHNSGTDADDSFFLGIEPDGRARFQVSTGNTYRQVWSTTRLNYGQWHQLAGVFTGAEIRIYVDGRLENSAAIYGQLAANSTPLLIGGSHDGAGGRAAYFFNGGLDDVRISNYARRYNGTIADDLNFWINLASEWRFEGDFIGWGNQPGSRYFAAPSGLGEKIRFAGE